MARSTRQRSTPRQRGTAGSARPGSNAAPGRYADEAGAGRDRLAALEARVDVLDEAVRVLARGLEPHPTEEPEVDAERAARAATRAHELLIAARR